MTMLRALSGAEGKMASGASRGGHPLSVGLQAPWPRVLVVEGFCAARRRGQERGRKDAATSFLRPQLKRQEGVRNRKHAGS